MPATRLANRVIARLAEAEACELNPWLRDDLRIARLTVAHAMRGDAKTCSPHVLASYEVLGVHPEKVWPKIEARKLALGPLQEVAARKKPPQSVKLWSEDRNAAKVASSRGAIEKVLREPAIRLPMATAPLAAAYPNSDAPSSGKKGEYSYDEAVDIIERSGAAESIRNLTLAAFALRGRWPKKQGPVSPVITVSVRSLVDKSGVYRSTVQRRIQRAMQGNFWRKTRDMNVWLECPKCGAERKSAECPNQQCGHKGNGHNPKEFRATVTYAVDLERFERTPPCRHVQQIRLKKAEVRQMPAREAVEPAPQVQEPVRKTAEHQKQRTVVETQITADATKLAQRVFEYCGLADIGLIAKIAIALVAEAKFQGIEIEAAAKHIAESALRDQRNGVTLNAFYWRDQKWRTNGGGQQQNASQQRTHANRQAALGGIYREVLNDFPGERTGSTLALGESSGGGTVPDRRQREHESERGKGG